MMRPLLLFTIAARLWAVPSVVQVASPVNGAGEGNCYGFTLPTVSCAMTSNVTNGNLLVVLMNKTGGDLCRTSGSGPLTGVHFSDSLGSTFTAIASAINVNGGQSNACIVIARLSSSGADTITLDMDGETGSEHALFIYEVAGSGSLSTTSAVVADSVATITSDTLTGSGDGILFCSTSDNTQNLVTGATPSGATTIFVQPHPVGIGVGVLYKVVNAFSGTCSFTKGSGDYLRGSLVGALIGPPTPRVPIRVITTQ